MEELIKEAYIEESPIPISIENSFKILNHMKNRICKIYAKGNTGTGFFCKINYNSKLLPFLITNNHILNEEDIVCDKKIKISSMNDGQKNNYHHIIINKERIVYTNEELDVTLIEIKSNLDEIDTNRCLELDDDIDVDEEYLNEIYKSIYVLHYPKNKNISSSFGLISEINGREIKHL